MKTLAHQNAEDLREVGETVADTVVKTTDAAVEIGQRVAEQGQEVMMLGVRAAAGMNGRLAEAGYGRGHRMLGAAARALQVWQEASNTTAENVQALFSTYLTVGHGLQQMQHAYLEIAGSCRGPGDSQAAGPAAGKTLEEFAEVQRDLYLDAVNHALESSTTLLQIAAQTAQQAMRPLAGPRRRRQRPGMTKAAWRALLSDPPRPPGDARRAGPRSGRAAADPGAPAPHPRATRSRAAAASRDGCSWVARRVICAPGETVTAP